MKNVSVLITAGGKGTRLWPVSTLARPKQFCALTGDKTMLQDAFDRAAVLVAADKIFIGVSANQRAFVKEQIPQISDANIIVEPEGRDTAPAIAFATAYIKALSGDGEQTMIVFAADQMFQDEDLFQSAMEQAVHAAESGSFLVSVGVVPTEPNTQYGYMRCGEQTSYGKDAFYGEEYIEKPNLETAKKLVAAGSFIWNTNIFVWRVNTLLAAYKQYQPKDNAVIEKIEKLLPRIEPKTLAELYAQLTKVSIDYAVMEKVQSGDPFRHVFVKGHFGWTDIGNFDALADYLKTDSNKNQVRGDVKAVNTTNCILISEAPFRLEVSDIHDKIVVASAGNVLVVPRGEAASIKQIIASPLNTNLAGRSEALKVVNVDAAGNEVKTFVRLLGVKDCAFAGDGKNLICAGNVSGLSVDIKGTAVRVGKRTSSSNASGESLQRTQFGNFNVMVREDYDDMSETAAAAVVDDIKGAIAKRGKAAIVLSAGGTPEGLCKLLRTRYKDAVDWKKVTLFQMDDYKGLSVTHPQSLSYFLLSQAVQPLGLGASYFLNDEHGNLAHDLKAYDRLVEEHGGIDVIVHGIGENGHLGFNEPGTLFDSETRIVDLAESTIEANSRFFEKMSDVPTQGVTMGFKKLCEVRKTYILASGPKKAAAIHRTVLGAVSQDMPASIMRKHPNTVVIIDRGACSWIEAN